MLKSNDFYRKFTHPVKGQPLSWGSSPKCNQKYSHQWVSYIHGIWICPKFQKPFLSQKWLIIYLNHQMLFFGWKICVIWLTDAQKWSDRPPKFPTKMNILSFPPSGLAVSWKSSAIDFTLCWETWYVCFCGLTVDIRHWLDKKDSSSRRKGGVFSRVDCWKLRLLDYIGLFDLDQDVKYSRATKTERFQLQKVIWKTENEKPSILIICVSFNGTAVICPKSPQTRFDAQRPPPCHRFSPPPVLRPCRGRCRARLGAPLDAGRHGQVLRKTGTQTWSSDVDINQYIDVYTYIVIYCHIYIYILSYLYLLAIYEWLQLCLL